MHSTYPAYGCSKVESNASPRAVFKFFRNPVSSISSASSMESLQDVQNLSRTSSTGEIVLQDDVSSSIKDQCSECSDESKRPRSYSDGNITKQNQHCDVFPSLPDVVLENLGLSKDKSAKPSTDEELEHKFIALSLAFTIDSSTVGNRCERQKRLRDQTEKNFMTEIDKFTSKINSLNRLCVDMETTELVTSLLDQIDVLIRASKHLSTSAEKYGAVQHEIRLVNAVEVMLAHVESLKQQRDAAKRQLQYTKNVLHDTDMNKQNKKTPEKLSPTISSDILTRRRASIATTTEPQNGQKLFERRITRRIQDVGWKSASNIKAHKLTRPDLSDLQNIKEGSFEQDVFVNNVSDTNGNSVNETVAQSDSRDSLKCLEISTKDKLSNFFGRIKDICEYKYHIWCQNGSISEMCYSGALICFSIGIILLVNLFVELQFNKDHVPFNKFKQKT